jgi:hypothetical protein
MKILRIAAIIALLLPACSCVPLSSYFPLWDEQHAAFEAHLLGEWRDKDSSDDGVLRFTEAAGKTYQVAYTEKEKNSGKIVESVYMAKLVRLEKHLFLDFIGDEASINKRLGEEECQSMIFMHFFARLELDGDTLKLAFLDDEKFEKKVLKKEINLPILKRGKRMLITAETPKIQQELSHFVEDKDLWGDDTVMPRKLAP